MISPRFTLVNSVMPDLSRKSSRKTLKVRHDPYWQRLSEGAYLGFRRGAETWIARYRDRDRRQQYAPLGGPQEFDEAKEKAEAWLAQMGSSAARTPKRDTVRAALETYVAALEKAKRDDAAKEAKGRFKLTVYEDVLADVSLEDATSDDFSEWRDRLTGGREPRSVNRHVRSVIAALNLAHRAGHVGNPEAWRLKALPDDVDDADVVETAVYMTPEQRKALIAAATPAAALFFRGLEMTGARPSELAAAKVSHFAAEKKHIRLASRKGRKSTLRVRYTELIADEDVAFFAEIVGDRSGDKWIFSEDAAGAQPWRRHMWSRAMRAAIEKHNETAKGKERLPKDIGAYSFRHTRISELLQVHGIDPLTTAQQTGTSGAMIEKHYLKFIPSALRKKLDAMKAKAA